MFHFSAFLFLDAHLSFSYSHGKLFFAQVSNLLNSTDATDKATWITKETYDELADKTGYSALTISNICEKSEDEELQNLASKLSYDAGKVTMTSTSNSKYEAIWNIAEGTVTGKKK